MRRWPSDIENGDLFPEVDDWRVLEETENDGPSSEGFSEAASWKGKKKEHQPSGSCTKESSEKQLFWKIMSSFLFSFFGFLPGYFPQIPKVGGLHIQTSSLAHFFSYTKKYIAAIN